jgi:Atypical PilZ domain, cyclic di-GMP receptor
MEQTPALVVACSLPLELRPLAALPTGAALAQCAHLAVQVLQGELTADERRRVEPRTEEDSAVLQDLHRVEAKLDLLLDLFAQWHQREHGLPPAVDCRWSAVDLQWECTEVPSGFAAMAESQPWPALLKLYAGPRSLRPLELPGFLTAAVGPAGMYCQFVYAPLGDVFTDVLGRYLFRLHRREIAETRAASRR